MYTYLVVDAHFRITRSEGYDGPSYFDYFIEMCRMLQSPETHSN